MSELRSVIAFFLGLVFFIVLIGLAIGRIRIPRSNQQVSVAITATPTPTVVPTRKPGLLDRIAGIFRRTTPTPTMTIPLAQPTLTNVPVGEMKEALDPERITGGRVVTTKGGQVIAIDETGPRTTVAEGTQTIPDSGAPTLLFPLSLLLGGFGLKLRKRA